MKLGVCGLVPADPRHLNDSTLEGVRRAGFTGIQLFFRDPFDFHDEDLARIKGLLEAHQVILAQCNGDYPFLVDPTEERRLEGVAGMNRLCEIGKALNATTVYVRPGSVNPAGPWTAHRENRSATTRHRLVRSLSAIVEKAEEIGVKLSLEGHVLSPLPSPEVLRDVVRAVGSPALVCNMDPVNFVSTLEEAFDTNALLDRLFDCVGEYAISGHIKDVAVGERLVLHFDEVLPGTGLMDLPSFFRRLAKALPHNGFALIEHLADADIPAAREAVVAAATNAGISF